MNVYAIGNPDISDPNDVPWDFVLRIFNRSGQVAQEQRLQLAPGVTASVEISIGNPDIFPVDRLGRRTLRAEIVGFNPQPDPPGAYFATLEVYNLATGGTSVLLGLSTRCRPPLSDGHIVGGHASALPTATRVTDQSSG